jgi:hypothetical protein
MKPVNYTYSGWLREVKGIKDIDISKITSDEDANYREEYRQYMVKNGFEKVRCPFFIGWTNKEGWFMGENGQMVCMDWDDYCTLCRVDDSKDFEFGIDEAEVYKLENRDPK